MSYARFGGDGSDVYVYMDVNGTLACCGCKLGDQWYYPSTDEMVTHLEAHIAAGHTVPDYVISEIRADDGENFPSGGAA